jgi:hypothetical protein
MTLPKWTEKYPQGTKEGDEELVFFICLARHPKYVWRSAKGISSDINIPVERVEQIIEKYYKLGMIIPSPTNEDNWGYWERVPASNLPKKVQTVLQKDHKDRMRKANSKIMQDDEK